MKTKLLGVIIVGFAFNIVTVHLAHAGFVSKAATGTNLNAGASWIGNTAPVSGDIATWSSSSLGAGLTLGSGASWQGIGVTDALTDINITGAGTLTLGAAGIDLSASMKNLGLACSLALQTNQPWTVKSNLALTVNSQVSGAGGFTKAGAGTVVLGGGGITNSYSGPTVVNSGTLKLQLPSLVLNPTLPVTNGLVAKFDASAMTGLTAGQTVNTWNDTSGNGNNATLTEGTPTYQTGALNGKPVVRFTPGTRSSFTLAARRTDVQTVFWVVNEANLNDFHFFLGDTPAGNAADFHRGQSGIIWSGQWASSKITSGTTRLDGTQVDGTSTALGTGWHMLDVVAAGPVTVGTITSDRGYDWRTWEGDMAEILIYNVALSPTDVASVEIYLTQKWLTAPVAAGAPLSPATAVSVAAGGTLDLNAVNPTISGLSGNGGMVTNGGASAATLTLAGSSATNTFSGILVDGNSSLALALNGANTTLILNSTNNAYTGGTTIGGGATLQLGDGTANNGSIVGNITDNGTLVFANPADQILVDNILGSGPVVKIGNGTLNVPSALLYSGNTLINAGNLRLDTHQSWDGHMTQTAGISIAGGASLTVNQEVQNPGLNSTPLFITGGGSFVKTGLGGVYTPSAVFNMAAGGLVDVESGSLLSISTDPNNLSNLKIAASATNTLYSSCYFDALTGSGILAVDSFASGNSLTVTIGVNGGSGAFSGVVADNLGDSGNTRVLNLTKTGAGIQVLSGTNTYTGSTEISGGTLAASVMNSTVTVDNGTLFAGANLAGIGSLSLSNNLILNSGATVLVNLNKSLAQSNSLFNVAGTLANNGGAGVTLAVNNLGPALQVGDQFQVFSKPFDTDGVSVTITNGQGYTFNNNLAADGSISVATAMVIAPPTLSFAASGNNLTFTWTGGGSLEWQTNGISKGLGTNWVAYPNGTNGVIVPINSTRGCAFFRVRQ